MATKGATYLQPEVSWQVKIKQENPVQGFEPGSPALLMLDEEVAEVEIVGCLPHIKAEDRCPQGLASP